MKIIRSWCILCLCLLLCTGCKNYADTLDCHDLDVSSVQAVQLGSGITGEKVWLTDPDDIQTICDCILQITGDTPQSSQGYYGYLYYIYLYHTPEDAEPFWKGTVCPENAFLGMEIYESTEKADYNVMYQLTGISADEISAICEAYFPE